MNIPEIISAQKAFFKTQKTKNLVYRLQLLKALKAEIIANEQNIYTALNNDFKKPKFESFLSEFGLVISALNLSIKNLKKWAKPQRVKASILMFPSKDYIYNEPYGTVLVIGPWNYPFLLALEPLIMAIAAGNTVVLKPSELTENTSNLIEKIIVKVFPETVVKTILGGVDTSTELLAQRWDYIFFTGSVPVGKIVAKAAAKHLTPVTLELGGKSPCIVDETVNLKLAAKRIVWGKFLNGGQTCVAADYAIVHKTIKNDFVEAIKNEINKAYGENIETSKDYPLIINEKNTKRLAKMLLGANILYGGNVITTKCFISPTLVAVNDVNSALMKDEIFGPILPILTYETEVDIENIIWHYEKPLAFYIFSNNKKFVENSIKKFAFGGGVVNDLLIHLANHKLPFGGVGHSGIGAYHGKYGFDTFTHKKAIVKRSNWIDPPVRYAPYTTKKFKLLKTMFKWFG